MALHHTAETLRLFREACARAESYTRTNKCTAYVNARVHRHMTFDKPEIVDFSLTFHVYDWYSQDSTVARYDNGERASNFY